jgi:hypothetical protein
MDSTRFDALTRSLATATNRRALVRSALAAVAAGVGGAMGRGSVLADGCKEDGKLCKKHEQCCSGLCTPSPGASSTSASDSVCCTPDSNESTCSGLCGLQTNNCGQSVDCGECCSPDAHEVTCAGLCGPQTNNCDVVVECGKCGEEICEAHDQCASGDCCESICCDETQPSTYTCCGPDMGCCDCFATDDLPICHSGEEICGTYPNDRICASALTCFDGVCVRPVYLCPFEVGGDDVYCTTLPDGTGAGCCGGLCCPLDRPICANGACVAVQTCSYDSPSCDFGTCTATEWNKTGTCCTNMHSFKSGVDENGVPVIVNECCDTDEKWDEICHCTPIHWEGCGEPTSRTSYPRIG